MTQNIFRISSIFALAAVMAACGGKHEDQNSAAAALPQSNAVASPGGAAVANGHTPDARATGAGSKAATDANLARGDLSRYLGQYPGAPVDGMAFLTDPLVAKALARAVPDPVIRAFVLNPHQTSTPISRSDGLIIASGCEQHNCGAHNWTMAIAPDGTQLSLCVFNGAVDTKNGQIYASTGKPTPRPGSCWQ